jgi:hypothetical protein
MIGCPPEVAAYKILFRAKSQAASVRSFTAHTRVRNKLIPRGICGGKCGTDTDFSTITSTCPSQNIPQRSILIHSSITFAK